MLAAAGLLATLGMTLLLRPRSGLPLRLLTGALCAAAIGAFFGAKALFAWATPGALELLSADAATFWSAGFVFYGGLLGGVLAGALVAAVCGISPLRLTDLALPGLALGHALGRVGCFLGGCCYGSETHLPFGVHFPGESVARLPVQLWEAAFLLLLWAILCRLFLRGKRGSATVCYLLGYGTWRFLIELLRADPRGGYGLLSTSQWVSLALLLIGGALWLGLWLYAKARRRTHLVKRPV